MSGRGGGLASLPGHTDSGAGPEGERGRGGGEGRGGEGLTAPYERACGNEERYSYVVAFFKNVNIVKTIFNFRTGRGTCTYMYTLSMYIHVYIHIHV